MLKEIPVDTNKAKFKAAAPDVRPAYVYNTNPEAPKVVATNEQGVPLYNVELLAVTDKSMDKIVVKVPFTTPPTFVFDEQVQVRDLIAKPGGDRKVFFSAGAVISLAGGKREG